MTETLTYEITSKETEPCRPGDHEFVEVPLIPRWGWSKIECRKCRGWQSGTDQRMVVGQSCR